MNRDDVFGAYVHPDRRARTLPDGTVRVTKSYTAPSRALRGYAKLMPMTVARHFAGRSPADVIGLHSTAPELTCKWGVIEYDRHEDDADPDANLRAALHLYRLLRRLGFRPWLSDSDGKGGLHVRVVFDRPVDVGRLFRFLRRLCRDHARRFKLAGPPECFPKNDVLTGQGYGNWLRLPGRHHTRDHWTTFYAEGRWLAGTDAVAYILNSRPDPADLLPDIAPAVVNTPPSLEGRSSDRPAHRGTADSDRPRMTDVEVALKCLAAIPNGGCHFDTWLRVGLALASVEHSEAMRSAWVQWSAGSAKHKADECARRWPTFGGRSEGRKATLGTLVYLARQAGHDPFPMPKADSRAGTGSAAKPKHPPASRRLLATSLPGSAARPAGPALFAVRPSSRGVA